MKRWITVCLLGFLMAVPVVWVTSAEEGQSSYKFWPGLGCEWESG